MRNREAGVKPNIFTRNYHIFSPNHIHLYHIDHTSTCTTWVHPHTPIYTYMHSYAPSCTFMHPYASSNTCTHPHASICTHIHLPYTYHTPTCTCMHPHAATSTYMYLHASICIHMYLYAPMEIIGPVNPVDPDHSDDDE
jgi:hypothetical protein